MSELEPALLTYNPTLYDWNRHLQYTKKTQISNKPFILQIFMFGGFVKFQVRPSLTPEATPGNFALELRLHPTFVPLVLC